MTIWEEYQDEDQSNEYLRKYEDEFCRQLHNAGATDQEIDDILDSMWQTETFYESAKEAIQDLRNWERSKKEAP